ncbi:hypothetical protein [Halapricum hydrolyticum]|uniref:Uncharacterized protein n=1 Tax=Halapricum hydrolyticum TaxID=2979991 RepID=A0AAE3ICT5_9EURY|nr:hypothetical protein [Halapricum hydrolyticum]MCU4718118.1 hypothetical protein [Halapricum hydrolyticum]MCU4727374.1 hypothetical protein [Halapricum hydrolyticum]
MPDFDALVIGGGTGNNVAAAPADAGLEIVLVEPGPLDETLVGFYAWAGEAASPIEDPNLTNQANLEANPDQEPVDVFWESFPKE